MIKKISLLFFALSLPLFSFSQEEEDETKMVREVVTVMVDKAKFAAPAPPPPPAEEHGKKGKKKHHEEEVAPPPADTGSSQIPAPVSEIAKRADNWLKAKSTKYKKENGTNTGSVVSANVSFVFNQKLLNPDNDVDGKITMNVTIDIKEGKYRYTIKDIKHVANKEGLSGGSIYEKIPEAGSMKITDQTWKQIKSASYKDIQMVVDDLKAIMKQDGDQKKKDDW